MNDRGKAPWDEPVNELDTDQLLTEWFEEEAPLREPALLAPNVIARTALTRRRSRWLVRDWWRDLLRGVRWPSLVPALAAGVVAIVALVFAVVTWLPERASQPVLPDYVPADALIVSSNDASKKSTIAEAIAQAQPGDTVAILPGEYEENLLVDKDITLLGAGAAEEIVVRPAQPDEPVIRIDGGDATLTGFTVTGPGGGVEVVASQAVIDQMVFRDAGQRSWRFTGSGWEESDSARPSILVELFAEATITNNLLDGGGDIEVQRSSTALIEQNELSNGPSIALMDATGETVVRGNTITASGVFSIESASPTDLLIEGNVIRQRDPGIAILAFDLDGTIRGNTIEGANVGIQIVDRTTATIVDNTIDAVGVAFEIHEGVEPTISGNDLCGQNAIIALVGSATAPDVSDNTLCKGVPVVYER